MEKVKLVSFKTQKIMAFIPFIGIFLVVFTSMYNINRVKNKLNIFIYYLLVIIPYLFILIIAALIMKFFILSIENVILMTVLVLILFFITLLLMALVSLFIEILMLKKYIKVDEDTKK